MAETLVIRDWDKHFEISQGKRASVLSWVAIPNRHDGKGYRRLMRRENGPALYAAWILIVQVASKCPKRGVLKDADGPLTAEDLEMKTDCPAKLFAEAIQVLSSQEVAWLLRVDSDSTPLRTRRNERNGQDEQDKQTMASGVLSHDALESLDWQEVLRICREVNKVVPVHKTQDRSLLLKAAVLSLVELGEHWLRDSVEAVRIAYAKTPQPAKPRPAYLHGILASKCKDLGRHFNSLLKQVELPDAVLNPAGKPQANESERGEPKSISELLKST